MKYVIVTGGVLSGLGKGITTSSIGLLLKNCGFKVTSIKIDPYLNCDAGTMNPYQHGEVFVLDDGSEVDLDLGNYERFLDINLTSDHNITTGKVYKTVIEKERRGDYLGNTVQIIPHITNEIRERIEKVAKNSGCQIALIEMGGTVGDIESMPFLEAARQLHALVGHKNVVFVHTTLVPVMGVVGEQKTKPTQHSVKSLMGLGIQPDIIVCRSDEPLVKATKEKLSLFCDIPTEAIISAYDVSNVYQVPLLLDKQGLTKYLIKRMGLGKKKPNLTKWRHFVNQAINRESRVKIALIGKYTGLKDSYISHLKAMDHSGTELGTFVDVKWIESDDLENLTQKKVDKKLEDVNGVIIPGGFGKRGSEGKMMAIRTARENNIPFLGICFGFQLAVIEFCRNVLKIKEATSSEFDKRSKYQIITLLPEQNEVKDMGGTMRLGLYPVLIDKNSYIYEIYKKQRILERHRHRYEINPEFISRIEAKGLVFSGRSPDKVRMEIAHLKGHPYFLASQFHPEFKSHPMKPAPLYYHLVKAAIAHEKKTLAK
jgi:CTP synthase